MIAIRNLIKGLVIISTVALSACGGNNRNPENKDSMVTTTNKTADAGLASATNRKAIIDQLGKNFQKSESGQFQKRVATIAPFKIKLVNGKEYSYKDLATGKAVTLVYFSPSCEECQDFTKTLLKRMGDFKNTQLIFITYEDLAAVKQFYKQYGIGKFPQIKMGTEGYKFTVQKYYKVEHFPFVAKYNATGHLIQIYANNTQPEKLAEEI